jgi:galactose mutarotase-like enzyme
MNLTEIVWAGFEAVALDDDVLRVVVVPQLGAKIVSLFDKRAGHEWLVNPTRPLSPVEYGSTFTQADLSGWDEMFPTIDRCDYPVEGQWKGQPLPDHGEVWTMAWQRESAEPDELVLRVRGRILPYFFKRTMSLPQPGVLRLHYQAINVSEEPIAYLWAAHPLFAANEATEIILPSHIEKVLNVIHDERFGTIGTLLDWWRHSTETGQQWALNRVRVTAFKDARKFYIPPHVPISQAALKQTDSDVWLRFEWDSEQIPYLGIWVDEGLYSAETNVALEPSNGFYDNLSRAWAGQRAGMIPAHSIVEWLLYVHCGVGDVHLNTINNP